jgi:small subunit ribosomal protein S8e
MGISRDTLHKKKLTGGKKRIWRKKRKHELGRPPANTRIGNKQISLIRVRGGNFKKRALKLDSGNFSLISLGITRKAKIFSVVYNASNNELVRTNTLVKGSIVSIDATPFKEIYRKNRVEKLYENAIEEKKHLETPELYRTFQTNNKKPALNSYYPPEMGNLNNDFENKLDSGKILARICSRPGQTGRSDGYILEGDEFEFYMRKIEKKKL